MSPIRVLICDDSASVAAAIEHVLKSAGDFEVVGIAPNGQVAVDKVVELGPDVVTMDLHMPVMDGIEAIERIMTATPARILVLTGDVAGASGRMGVRALGLGAIDVMLKPVSLVTDPESRRALADRLRRIAGASVVRRLPVVAPLHLPPPPIDIATRVIGLVAGTGGPAALSTVLGDLPQDFPIPMVLVQHIDPGFRKTLASVLDETCALKVGLAEDGVHLDPGTLSLVPVGFDLRVDPEGYVQLSSREDGGSPSGDLMLQSLADSFGATAAGVLLTGMDEDGCAGLAALHAAGGLTIAQDQASCVAFGAPGRAIAEGSAAVTLSPVEIGATLKALARRG